MKTPYSYNQFQEKKEIPNLDGLRALSIIAVLLHHTPSFEVPALAALQENGRLGVQLFFIISGFLICTLFIREQKANGSVSLYNFYIRRSLRLFPLYYLALAITALLVFGFHLYTPENQQLFKDKLWSYIFYYSNMVPKATEGPFFIAWSLAAEEQFYLFFGVLFAFTRPQTVLGVIVALLLVKLAYMGLFIEVKHGIVSIVLNYQPAILMGVGLAFLFENKAAYAVFRAIFGNSAMLGVVIICILVFFTLTIITELKPIEYALFLLMLTLFVGSVSLAGPLPILSWSSVKYIGKVSYGMYLLHMFAISAVKKMPLNPFIVFILAAIITIGLAALSYTFFETPFLQLKKRFEVKRDLRK